MVAIDVDDNGNATVSYLGGAAEGISANDSVGIGFIARVIEMMASNISISHSFNPETQDQQFEVIKCEWTRNNYLRIIDENPATKFMHAETPKEAMKRRRKFTCTRAVHSVLPKRRMPLRRF